MTSELGVERSLPGVSVCGCVCTYVHVLGSRNGVHHFRQREGISDILQIICLNELCKTYLSYNYITFRKLAVLQPTKTYLHLPQGQIGLC